MEVHMLVLLIVLAVLFAGWLFFPRHTFVSSYCLNILVNIDQTVNTIFCGDPDETISSRVGKGAEKGIKFYVYFAKFLDWFDEGHAKREIEADEGSSQISKS